MLSRREPPSVTQKELGVTERGLSSRRAGLPASFVGAVGARQQRPRQAVCRSRRAQFRRLVSFISQDDGQYPGIHAPTRSASVGANAQASETLLSALKQQSTKPIVLFLLVPWISSPSARRPASRFASSSAERDRIGSIPRRAAIARCISVVFLASSAGAILERSARFARVCRRHHRTSRDAEVG